MKALNLLPCVVISLFLFAGCHSEIPDEDLKPQISQEPLTEVFSILSSETLDLDFEETEKSLSNALANIVTGEYDEYLSLTLVDDKTNLVATVGYPDILPQYCGGGAPEIPILTKYYFYPSEVIGNQYVELGKGSQPAYIFKGPLSTEDLTTWCPYFSNVQETASGMVQTRTFYHETATQWQWTIYYDGKVMTPKNKEKKFIGIVRFTYEEGDEYETLVDLVSYVKVVLI